MKKPIVTLLIPFATLLLSCGGEEESCQDCVNNEVKSEVNDLYAKVIISNLDTLLRSVDSVTQKPTNYSICNDDILKSVDLSKVLRISGEILESCIQTENKLIVINDIVPIDYCHPLGKELEGVFSLFGDWLLSSIHLSDTILFSPCEQNISQVRFIENDSNDGFQNNILITGVVNTASVNFNINNKNQLNLDVNFLQTLASPSSPSGLLIETTLFDILSQDMIFSIKNNLLTLTSASNSNTHIKLYTYE